VSENEIDRPCTSMLGSTAQRLGPRARSQTLVVQISVTGFDPGHDRRIIDRAELATELHHVHRDASA